MEVVGPADAPASGWRPSRRKPLAAGAASLALHGLLLLVSIWLGAAWIADAPPDIIQVSLVALRPGLPPGPGKGASPVLKKTPGLLRTAAELPLNVPAPPVAHPLAPPAPKPKPKAVPKPKPAPKPREPIALKKAAAAPERHPAPRPPEPVSAASLSSAQPAASGGSSSTGSATGSGATADPGGTAAGAGEGGGGDTPGGQGGSALKPPEPLDTPRPPYPDAARRRGLEGAVQVRLLVGEDGCVRRVEILGARPQGFFEDAVRESLLEWRFLPARKGRLAVAAQVVTMVRFVLD